jgi:FlaA1/EpsC-like NDP-sugar epimerase
MGEPVRIVDLARDLIHLSGLPETAVDISYSGIRTGEKLHEELFFSSEEMLPTAHAKVHLAKGRSPRTDDVAHLVNSLEKALGESAELLRTRLREVVPEYQPPGHARCLPSRGASDLVPG